MNGFRPLPNDFVSASDQNIAKFTSKKVRCFGQKVHGKLRLRGRIRSSSQSIIHVVGVRPPSSSPLFSEVSIKGMREGGLDFESCRLGQIKVTADRGTY